MVHFNNLRNVVAIAIFAHTILLPWIVSTFKFVLKKHLFFKWNSITLKNGPKMHVKSKIITISMNLQF